MLTLAQACESARPMMCRQMLWLGVALLAILLFPGNGRAQQQALSDASAVAAAIPPSPCDSPDSPQCNRTQNPTSQDKSDSPGSDPTPSIFPHSESSRFWISGQANIILQWHPTFRARYSGPNSLSPTAQSATSRVFTLYTGVQLTRNTELLFDPESSSGGGIGAALGLAGYPNLDVVRTSQGVPIPAGPPYLARLEIHQIVPLSDERIAAERNAVGLNTSLPARRLEFRVGRFPLTDFFDVNSAGSDSHLQFLNWTIVNNGAWDYAADTRGYTWGAFVEYDDRNWSLRFAEALMPKFANDIHLDANIARARAENMEAEFRRNFLPHRAGIVRLLSYVNHGNMGNYRQAIDAFLAGKTPVPNVTKTERQGRIKYGFGVNLEQSIARDVTAFGRFGWNEGHNESFAYTEVNQSISFGVGVDGRAWHRTHDQFGAAFVLNAISGDHRRYLALGGLGFLLGDGALTYGREKIFETYYTAHLWRGIFVAFDLQHINNPGYNQARGPVLVPATRLHVEF